MNNHLTLSDLHPCEVFLVAGIIIFDSIVDLIEACLLLFGLKTKQLNRSTVDSKKIIDSSVAVTQSKPPAPPLRSKLSRNSSASTKSTTPRRTKKRSTPSLLQGTTLPGILNNTRTKNETKGFAAHWAMHWNRSKARLQQGSQTCRKSACWVNCWTHHNGNNEWNLWSLWFWWLTND